MLCLNKMLENTHEVNGFYLWTSMPNPVYLFLWNVFFNKKNTCKIQNLVRGYYDICSYLWEETPTDLTITCIAVSPSIVHICIHIVRVCTLLSPAHSEESSNRFCAYILNAIHAYFRRPSLSNKTAIWITDFLTTHRSLNYFYCHTDSQKYLLSERYVREKIVTIPT